MFLCIDVGNTRTKAAVYNKDGDLIQLIIFDENALAHLNALISSHHPLHAIVSTTGEQTWNIDQLEIPGKKIELTHQTPMPVKLVYSTPATLGRDRIAAACGVNALYPGKNCLVINAGTCMTSDVVLDTGIFLGGNIAPGLNMRLHAMHEYTARLPLVEPGWPELPFGDSTIHALQNGACLGMVMEIEGIFQRAKNAFGEVFVVMTGGDAAFLAEQIESQIFVAPELVTQGLFQILAFNV